VLYTVCGLLLRVVRTEKRRGGSTSTSHKAKSSKDVDYNERLNKPEPKFEPRISMYKYDPVQGVSRHQQTALNSAPDSV